MISIKMSSNKMTGLVMFISYTCRSLKVCLVYLLHPEFQILLSAYFLELHLQKLTDTKTLPSLSFTLCGKHAQTYSRRESKTPRNITLFIYLYWETICFKFICCTFVFLFCFNIYMLCSCALCFHPVSHCCSTNCPLGTNKAID